MSQLSLYSSEKIKNILTVYGQTLSWQQQVIMDRVRMQGDSGIQQVRNLFSGTKPWWQNTWSRELPNNLIIFYPSHSIEWC